MSMLGVAFEAHSSATQVATADAIFWNGFDQPNYVFVTSTTHSGNLDGLGGADAICNWRATAAGLPGTYVAWLSTYSANVVLNAPARLGAARGWIRVDGAPVADQISDLTSGHLFYPISHDEYGVFVGEVLVWTATNRFGTYSGDDCQNWRSEIGGATAGYASNDNRTFTELTVLSCSTPSHLYCFGVDNEAHVAPAAISARSAFVSGSWTPGGGVASADAKCSTDAAAARLSGTYKALLATTSASAISRFNITGLPWASSDGTLLATTAFELGAQPEYLLATPNGDVEIWAGAASLTGLGTLSSTCNDWVNPLGTATAGQSGFTKVAAWRAGAGARTCSAASLGLVCLEE